MSVDLSTEYLGLKLKNPLAVAACNPLTGNLDMLKRLEDAGASLAVLPSLFEEQIEHEAIEIARLFDYQTESFAESLTHFPLQVEYKTGPEEYWHHIEAAKKAVDIPIIGSLNGSTEGGWVEYAAAIQQAGADALELNIYFVPTDPSKTALDIEQQYIDLVARVREAVTIPLAVKIGQNFSSLPNFAQKLAASGADGLVLFNRYVEADIDLETLHVKPDLVLSNRHEARGPIRWIAILRDQLEISLAANSGIHRMQGALKLLLAGADVTMMASALIKGGPSVIRVIREELQQWLEEHQYDSISQLQGSMSQANCPDPSALERANYMKALTTFVMDQPIPQ